MEPFRWRRAFFLGLVSCAASLAGLVFDTFVPVLLQAGHPLWHNTTGLLAPPVGFALAPSLAFFIMTWDKPTVSLDIISFTFHRITWWSPEPFTIVLRFQRVPSIVSHQLARPDDREVTHGHSSQTDARKPHHHR
jgi:hypothetical protein